MSVPYVPTLSPFVVVMVAARSSGLPCSTTHGDDKTDVAMFGIVMRAIKNSKIIS